MKTLNGFITLFCVLLSLAVAGTPVEPEFLNVDVWPKSKNDGALHEIVEDHHGFLWATSTFGVYRYDGHTVKGYFNNIDSTSLSNSFAEALFVDSNGDLWIGAADGLNRYRYATDDFERFDLERFSGHRIYRIYEDNQKDLWLGTGAGLVYMNRQTLEKELYVPEEWKRVSVHGIRAIVEDREDRNTIWVGGVMGLFSFDKANKKIKHHPMPYANKEGWDCMINQMVMDSTGVLWCGTWGVFLLSFDTRTGRWNQYTTGRGVAPYPDSVIFDLRIRNEESLWVANGTGVGMFDKSTGEYTLYEHDPVNSHSLAPSYAYFGIYLTQGGNLAVVGQSSISISSPVIASAPGVQFPPVISRITLGDVHLSTDSSTMELRRIGLEDHQKDLSLTLGLPGSYFFDPAFSYRMEGYDNDWKSIVKSNTIRYTNLPRGNYVLRYRASSDGKNWVEGSPLHIEKAVFFWKTPGFYFLIGLIILGVLLLIYFLRIRLIRREAALKMEFNKKIADIEMAALRAQMNPHFLFNSMNSIKYYIINEEPDLANKYLTKFSRLMRLVLKNSQSQLISLADEIEALRLYIEMEALRFKEDFQYVIDIDEDIDEEEILVPPLIIQPYVENAIWHGLLQKQAPGKLKVLLEKNGDSLFVMIEDDGIGREAAKAMQSKSATKKSFGTRITKDRIALVSETLGIHANVDISDLKKNGSPCGTRVAIVLPVIREQTIQAQ